MICRFFFHYDVITTAAPISTVFISLCLPDYYDETLGAEKGLFRETLLGELVVAWCYHDKEAEG